MTSNATSSSVEIDNLPSDLSEDELELLLESERYCPCGGDVKSVEMSSCSGTAVVTFEEAEVAQRLLAKRTIEWNGKVLTVKRCKPKPLPKPSNHTRRPGLKGPKTMCCSLDASPLHSSNNGKSSVNVGLTELESEIKGPKPMCHSLHTSPLHSSHSSKSSLYMSLTESQDSDSSQSEIKDPKSMYHSLDPSPLHSSNNSKSSVNVSLTELHDSNNSLTKWWLSDDSSGSNKETELVAERRDISLQSGRDDIDGDVEELVLSEPTVDLEEVCIDESPSYMCEKCIQLVDDVPSLTVVDDTLLGSAEKVTATVQANHGVQTRHASKGVEDMCRVYSTDELYTMPAVPVLPINKTAPKFQVTSDVQHKKTLDLTEEQVKLLSKLRASKQIRFDCDFKIESDGKSLTLVGTEDELAKSQVAVYELITRFCNSSVRLTKGLVKLLMSRNGEQWLQKKPVRHQLVCLLYTKDAVPYIMALDEDILDSVKAVLANSLASESLPFQAHQTKFLQSKPWMEAIESFESSSFLVISTDYAKKVIEIEGCTDAVKDIKTAVNDLLKKKKVPTATLR